VHAAVEEANRTVTADLPGAINLPSVDPPPGVELRIGWVVAALFWRAHTPANLPGQCERCHQPWPCLSVRWADAFLDSTVLTDEQVAASVHDTQPISKL
jgi:hypothetical protein